MQALLAAHADIDVQNTNCNTALHLAAGKGLQPIHSALCLLFRLLLHYLLMTSPANATVMYCMAERC